MWPAANIAAAGEVLRHTGWRAIIRPSAAGASSAAVRGASSSPAAAATSKAAGCAAARSSRAAVLAGRRVFPAMGLWRLGCFAVWSCVFLSSLAFGCGFCGAFCFCEGVGKTGGHPPFFAEVKNPDWPRALDCHPPEGFSPRHFACRLSSETVSSARIGY